MRDPNTSSDQSSSAWSYPIARYFGLTVIAALVGLFILHHLVFSVNVTGGVK